MFRFKLLPAQADNVYRGNKFALPIFVFFLSVMTWRSLIHMFFERYGLHEIANFIILTGEPDPNPVVYRFFSLWGFQQLIFCFISWVIVWRYRSLMALVCGLWIVEWGVRVFYYPNFKDNLNLAIYASETPPGIEWASYVFCFLIVIFLLMIKTNDHN